MSEAFALDIIDTHVHLRDPASYPENDRGYKEFGAESALMDLANSGVLMANAMPNTNTPLTTYAAFKTYATTLKDEPGYGGTYFCYNGKNYNELLQCFGDTETRKHMVGVKIYPASQSGQNATTSFSAAQDMRDFSLEDNSELDQLANFCSHKNLSITIHCEDPDEKEKLGKKYGTIDDETEPHFVENIAIPLCEKYPQLKFIVAHVSHRRTTEILTEAWDAGMNNLYAEITPHHLLLSTQEIQEKLGDDAVFGFCHPFIKISGTHRYALAQMLRDGKYQEQILYGSDHAPHPEWKKRAGGGGVPNHQGGQIVAAWFRSQGIKLDDPRVTHYFNKNAQRVFAPVPEYVKRFKQRAGSILFAPADFEPDGMSIPRHIHNYAVVNPWERLLPDAVKEHWLKIVHN